MNPPEKRFGGYPLLLLMNPVINPAGEKYELIAPKVTDSYGNVINSELVTTRVFLDGMKINVTDPEILRLILEPNEAYTISAEATVGSPAISTISTEIHLNMSLPDFIPPRILGIHINELMMENEVTSRRITGKVIVKEKTGEILRMWFRSDNESAWANVSTWLAKIDGDTRYTNLSSTFRALHTR